RVVLADRWIFGVRRQRGANRADFALDVDRAVLGGFVFEDDDDRRNAFSGARRDVVDVVDGDDGVFDLFGDELVDGFGAGARVDRDDLRFRAGHTAQDRLAWNDQRVLLLGGDDVELGKHTRP